MNKFLHIIAIEYPIVSVFIVICMVVNIYMLGELNQIDQYIEIKEKIIDIDSSTKIQLMLDETYYRGIKENNKAIWYKDLDSAVYDAKVLNVVKTNGKCQVELVIDPDDVRREQLIDNDIINIKISYSKEKVLKHLLSAN